MRIDRIVVCCLVFISLSCTAGKHNKDHGIQIVVQKIQTILDSADLNGSILIYHLNADTFYSNDFRRAEKGFLPASTFKIANSIIALECGVVDDDSTLIKWDGQKRRMQIWERDMVFRDAFHVSCVPCYQEIARQVGVKRMNKYLDLFDYGHMQVNDSAIDLFWLEGDSRISQFEQINFLLKIYRDELPISGQTSGIIKRMMIIEQAPQFVLRGKTGWAIRQGNNVGWFVGYVEKDDDVYFFASNVEPQPEFDMDKFPVIRKDVTYKALKLIYAR